MVVRPEPGPMGSKRPNLLIMTKLLLELKVEGKWEKGWSLRISYS